MDAGLSSKSVASAGKWILGCRGTFDMTIYRIA